MDKLIYDVGMHDGTDTGFYLGKGFRVIGVEAMPALVETCKKRFVEEIMSGQLTIVDKAINDRAGMVDFFVFPDKSDWGTLHEAWNRAYLPDADKITVEAVNFKSVIDKHGMPYYMKIDIEGSDIFCLQALFSYKERPDFISVELLTPNNLGMDVEAMNLLCHLKALGYNRFLVSNQTTCDAHLTYWSGPFGEELEGEWVGIDGISMEYLKYFYTGESSMFKKNDWFDIHAKIE